MHLEVVRGPAFSHGAALLVEKKRELDLSAAEIGRKVGVQRHVVSRWLSGQRRASLEYAVKIETLYGIPVRAWSEEEPPPQRRRIRKAS